MKKYFGIFVGMAVLVFTGIMVTKVALYFPYRHGEHFLSTKTDQTLSDSSFLVGFYVHILSSLVVMFIGIFQFFPLIFRQYPSFHRKVGHIYLIGIVFFAAPSGLVLAFFANGGLPAKVAFGLQSLVWWWLSVVAWRLAVRRQFSEHLKFSFRSYAVTLAAMSLRLESYALIYFFGTKPIETYLTVSWLSWTGNLLLVEIAIFLGLNQFLFEKFKKKADEKVIRPD